MLKIFPRFARFAPRFASRLALVAVLATLTATPLLASDRDYEARGSLTRAADGQIPNTWSGMSRQEALMVIDALPTQYTSPVYYELARRLLLSDASAPPSAPEKPRVDAKGNPLPVNPNSPDLLIARLDKLLAMGALRDAESLYDKVVTDTPDDFGLATRWLEILMLRGQLPAACLDLQAMQGQHGNDPRWKELNRLCRIQFAGANGDRMAGQAKFVEYPQLNNYLRGRGLGNLRALSVQDMALAVATNLINPNSIAQLANRAGTMPSLLVAVLTNLDTETPVPEKMCLLIESVRRGIASTRDLITAYEKPHYDSVQLIGNPMGLPELGNVHPCMVPSVMYQRIASNEAPAARDATIRSALDVMADLPDAAFRPMALYFQDFQVRQPANRKYLWRVARVTAYEKDGLPQNWGQGWAGKNDRGETIGGVPPFWPLLAVSSPQREDLRGLDVWRQQWPAEASRLGDRNTIMPVLLGEPLVAPKNGKNPKGQLSDYENILSLTFSRSYSMPSYGLTQRLADVIEKGQTGQSVALLLIGYGAIPPDQVIPHQMALVIDGMNKAGLGRYARRLALEVLR